MRRILPLREFFIIFLSLVVVIYGFSFVKRLTQNKAEGMPKLATLRVQVLNGCGINKAAARVAEKLREYNLSSENLIFDVIDQRNFKDSLVTQTLIVDRVGNPKIAEQVADLLGIDRSNIIMDILKDNYLDLNLSLILGKDYQKLFFKKKFSGD